MAWSESRQFPINSPFVLICTDCRREGKDQIRSMQDCYHKQLAEGFVIIKNVFKCLFQTFPPLLGLFSQSYSRVPLECTDEVLNHEFL